MSLQTIELALLTIYVGGFLVGCGGGVAERPLGTRGSVAARGSVVTPNACEHDPSEVAEAFCGSPAGIPFVGVWRAVDLPPLYEPSPLVGLAPTDVLFITECSVRIRLEVDRSYVGARGCAEHLDNAVVREWVAIPDGDVLRFGGCDASHTGWLVAPDAMDVRNASGRIRRYQRVPEAEWGSEELYVQEPDRVTRIVGLPQWAAERGDCLLRRRVRQDLGAAAEAELARLPDDLRHTWIALATRSGLGAPYQVEVRPTSFGVRTALQRVSATGAGLGSIASDEWMQSFDEVRAAQLAALQFTALMTRR
ncbi:hypothetical protein [Sandaracinus amylolyticus]|uniref:hypothetical protein n=1 Tax=Sandaracinus amylolyticus TaxID=927083 RepID=UPI001F314643|nr:hypothetical protein [Sandaracinus amylolyticus]